MSSIKDQIRAEIERQMKYYEEKETREWDEQNDEDALWHQGHRKMCSKLLSFLDTLPEQPVDGLEEKDFVEEVRQYYSNNCTWDALKQPMLSIITRCARHFAEWGMNQCHLPEGLGKAAEGSDFRDKLAAYMKSAAEEGGYVLSSEAILKMAEEELLKRGFIQKPAEMKEDEE